MKQLFTLLGCIILLTACKTKDPTPNIITGLDPNFEKYLVDKKIDKDGTINGQMRSADAIGVDSLEIYDLQIKTLAGVEKFIDLQYLDCSENELSNLDISKNLNLQYLYCLDNQLSSLDISKNLNLQALGCSQNQLSNCSMFQVTNIFSNLRPGTYSFEVKDTDGHKGYTTVTLETNTTIAISHTIKNKDCDSSPSNTLTINATGGTEPYTYSLDKGSYQADNTFANLSVGNHIISVKDAQNCYQEKTVRVENNNSINITTDKEDEKCNADGKIIIKAEGGTPNYQYRLSTYPNYQALNTYDNVSAGIYEVFVKDAENNCGKIEVEIEKKGPEEEPTVIEQEENEIVSLSPLRQAGATTHYYVAPDGQGVQLPPTAIPLTFNFNGNYPAPPLGTLQGFKVNGEVYFAEIKGYANATFKGYRKSSSCGNGSEPQYYNSTIFSRLNATVPAIYQTKAKDADGCVHKGVPFNHAFGYDNGFVIDIYDKPSETQTSFVYKYKYIDQTNCDETTNYIAKNQLKTNDVKIDQATKQKLQNLIDYLNPKLSSEVNLTIAVVPKGKDDKATEEANKKGLKTIEKHQLESGDWIFFYVDISPDECARKKLDQRIKTLEASASYKNLGVLDKKLIYASYYAYNLFFCTLNCKFKEEKYYACDASGNNCQPLQPNNCTEAFVAGVFSSIVSDLNIVENISGIFDMVSAIVKGTINGVAELPKQFYNYPTEVKEGLTTLRTVSPNTSGTEIAKAAYKLIPPLKPSQSQLTFVANMASYFYNHYVSEGNCWRSGELTAMIAPIIFTGAAYAGTKVFSKLGGRAKSVFSSGEAFIDFFKAGKKLEHVDIPNGTAGDIKQIAKRNTDESIENIYEETSPNNYTKICGSCLAQNTAVFGTNATLENLQPLATVQTLEKDGSIGTRNVWGKVGRKVSEYVKIFVGKDELQSTTEHEFKTAEGWKPASYLRKGALLFSLALNSFVPVDSVALVHEPLEVEGLSLGDVQGYGVGSLGVITADGRVCVLGLAGEWQDDIDALLGEDKAARFYRDMNKTSPAADKKRAEKYLEQIRNENRAVEIANMWEITNGRGNIAGNIRALRESDDIADYYWDNVPASRYNYTDKALWLNQAFRNGSGSSAPLFQAHHVIPIDVLETNPDLQKLFKWARDNGHSTFDYNNIDNGIMVITKKVKLDINGHGNHPNYSAKIQTKVSDIIGRKGMSVDAINEIKDEINRIKNKINSDVIRGNFDIDNLNF